MTIERQNSISTEQANPGGPVWLHPPKSRFRIYSTPGQYFSLAKAIISGKMAPGAAIQELEQQLVSRFDVPHAIAVNQGRVGIYLAIKAVVTPDKPKVVMSPYTIYDVVNMVIAAGGEPVFADIDQASCNMDPHEVAKLIDDETCAVMVTHLHGLAADIEAIASLCKKRGVMLIEDSAQAFGVRKGGKYLGTFGDIGIYSFGLFKTVNSFFGGVVTCQDKDLADKIRSLQADFSAPDRKRMIKRLIQGLVFEIASHPIVFKLFTFWVFRYGVLSGNEHIQKVTKSEMNPVFRDQLPNAYKESMSNMQAQMIVDQLDNIEAEQQARIGIAKLYHEALGDRNSITTPQTSPIDGNGCLAYPIQVDNRQEVLKTLMKQGRDCAPQHLHNCADLDIYKKWYRDCPNARKTSNSVILLPTYPRYGVKEALRNIAVLKNI